MFAHFYLLVLNHVCHFMHSRIESQVTLPLIWQYYLRTVARLTLNKTQRSFEANAIYLVYLYHLAHCQLLNSWTKTFVNWTLYYLAHNDQYRRLQNPHGQATMNPSLSTTWPHILWIDYHTLPPSAQPSTLKL